MSARRRWFLALLAACCAPAALPAIASADGFPLVGWWPLNEGSGQTVRDWSGHGNDGYLGTAPVPDAADPTWIRGVWSGSALHFGGDDVVTIPDSPDLEPASITVSAWFRGSGSPGPYTPILSKGVNSCVNASYALYSSANGGLAFYIGDGTGQYVRSPEAPAGVWDGRWHNAAGTFDGSVVRLFVDGREVGAGTPSAIGIGYDPPTGGGTMGDYGDPRCGLALTGDVDGVQVWSRALPVGRLWRSLQFLFTTAR